MKRVLSFILAGIVLLSLAGCAGGNNANNANTREKIIFSNAGWDSVQFHSAVAGYIATQVFGYNSWEMTLGSTPVLHQGLIAGEVDVNMEIWTDNISSYADDIAAGRFHELSVNFSDTTSGYYVPRYVIEGDSERGLAPLAPDLVKVGDLLQYAGLFPDEEIPGRARIYGAIPGWTADTIHYNKYIFHGLDKEYEYFRPGSQAAMDAAFTAAYTKGQPIVGYYWEPTWLMGKYDFVKLEETPYVDEETYNAGACGSPSQRVVVAASLGFMEKDPEFCEFLKKYQTSSAITAEALAYMQDSGADSDEAAKWFLQAHDELIDQFLTPEQAQKLRASL